MGDSRDEHTNENDTDDANSGNERGKAKSATSASRSGDHNSATSDTDKKGETDKRDEKDGKDGKLATVAWTAAITGFVGLFVGISSDWANNYSERADECYSALSKYTLEISNLPGQIAVMNTPNVPDDVYSEAVKSMNSGAVQAGDEVLNKCPVTHLNDTQYLTKEDAKAWVDASNQIRLRCTLPARSESRCSFQEATRLMHQSREISYTLESQADDVDYWNPLHIGLEALKRIFWSW